MKRPAVETAHLQVREARRAWEKRLREDCPVDGVVKVLWTADPPVHEDGEECNGLCGQDIHEDGTPIYTIQVWKGLDRACQAEMLCHEWAHALSWGQDPDGQDHGYRWGLAYRHCYQAVMSL